MKLEYIITTLIILATISLLVFVTYIAKKQVDFGLEDDGVDELKGLKQEWNNLIEVCSARKLIKEDMKEELKI